MVEGTLSISHAEPVPDATTVPSCATAFQPETRRRLPASSISTAGAVAAKRPPFAISVADATAGANAASESPAGSVMTVMDTMFGSTHL